jgi:regulator of CtrA degradation
MTLFALLALGLLILDRNEFVSQNVTGARRMRVASMSQVSQFPGFERKTISFAQKLASSDSFKALFKEGMGLVEASAAYLDGPGRAEAKLLPRMEALAYASESMRLTTRLMQLASWLLLQRAVNEGEMTAAQAAAEKHKVKLSRQELASDAITFARLPAALQDLCRQSLRLQARIMHLDELLYRAKDAAVAAPMQPAGVSAQLDQLRAAFAPRA